MKKQIISLYIAVALVLFIAVRRDNQQNHILDKKEDTNISEEKSDDKADIANPASKFCKEQGGTLEIRTLDDGGQYGVCVFKNGIECEEWDLFSGRCSKDGADFCGQSTYGKCSNSSDCMTDGCSGQICRSKQDEALATDCQIKECYNNKKYGLDCKCNDNQCQWGK